MPQGRRKVPFSGKAKKVQIQMKREKKEELSEQRRPSEKGEAHSSSQVVDPNAATSKSSSIVDVELKGKGTHRYELMFKEESKQEIAANRERARQPIKMVNPDKDLEVNMDLIYPASTDFPHRPPWSQIMSKSELEVSEARYFRNYVQKLMDTNEERSLSYFELNLETWRQLWRVIEMADIILVIVDVRCPTFPPSLYNCVNDKESQKNIILVINKVDLIPAGLALAWKDYFEKKFPNLSVVFFSSCPSYNLSAGLSASKSGLKFRRLKGRISMVAEGARSIFEECKRIAQKSPKLKDICLDSWWKKIENASKGNYYDNESEPASSAGAEAVSGEPGVLTIGTIGHPNVGKSSLINSLMGKKVVSVSKTPGHTKHFQTIFLSPAVKLCDCPGLVFPSLMPKPLQILQGSYPIAQTREPLSIVQYLAERVDVPYMLTLTHPEGPKNKWSAFDVCEAWAIKRGYSTARTNRPDVYRAANHILRMTLEGKITLAFYPPNYDKDFWESHPDLVQINDLLGISEETGTEGPDENDISDEEKSEEEAAKDSDLEEGEGQQNIQIHKSKFNVLMEDCSD